jgi:hypothetical protein
VRVVRFQVVRPSSCPAFKLFGLQVVRAFKPLGGRRPN